jgi:hypothetical protein
VLQESVRQCTKEQKQQYYLCTRPKSVIPLECLCTFTTAGTREKEKSGRSHRAAHIHTLSCSAARSLSRLFPVAIISIMGNKMENLWAHACKNRVFAWAKFTFLVRRSLLPCPHFANLPRLELNFNIPRCRCFNFYTREFTAND